MAKNNQLINVVKNTLKMAKQDTFIIEMMGAFALALNYKGMTKEETEDLLSSTQAIWNHAVANDINIIKWAKDQAGIELLRDNGEGAY